MKHRLSLLTSVALLMALPVSCGKFRAKDDRTVTITQEKHQEQPGVKGAFQAIEAFYDLYVKSVGGVSYNGLSQMLNHFQGALKMQGIEPTGRLQKIVELIYQIAKPEDPQGGLLNVKDIVQQIQQIVPVFKWIPEGRGLGKQELTDAIRAEYPTARLPAIDYLAHMLYRCDSVELGGNGNGKIERDEVALSGFLFGIFAHLDTESIEAKIAESKDVKLQLLYRALKMKLDQQVLFRFPEKTFASLDLVSRRLELMSLAVRFLHVSKLMDRYGGSIAVKTTGDLRPIYADLGIDDALTSLRMNRFYLKMNLGSLDSGEDDSDDVDDDSTANQPKETKYSINAVQLFNLVTDYEHARVLLTVFDATKNLSGDAGRIQNREYASRIRTHFEAIYPHFAKRLFTLDRLNESPDLSVFDSILENSSFSKDRKLDAPTLTMTLAFASLEEILFAQFDRNQDGVLTRKEVRRLLGLLNIHDSLALTAFMSNAGLDQVASPDPTVNTFDAIRILISQKKGSTPSDGLTAADFHDRMWTVLNTLFR